MINNHRFLSKLCEKELKHLREELKRKMSYKNIDIYEKNKDTNI